MAGMRWVLVLVAVAGCGRLGFFGIGDDAPDAASDGTNGDGAVCAFELCEGFERPTLQAGWTVDPMVTIDTTLAHAGAGSLHLHTPSFAAAAESYTSARRPRPSANTFWVRTWYWLSALPAGGNGMELLVAQQTNIAGPMGDYIFVFSDGTHVYSQFESSSMITSVVPTGSWFCLVFKVVLSPTTTGSLEMTGDRAATLPNVRTDDATVPVVELAWSMGFSANNVPDPQPALDLWIDDVIVHSAAITCAD